MSEKEAFITDKDILIKLLRVGLLISVVINFSAFFALICNHNNKTAKDEIPPNINVNFKGDIPVKCNCHAK